MLINNWFDLFIHTFFIVGMGIGIGIIGSIIVLIDVFRSNKKIEVSWSRLVEKNPPFVQNPLQTVLTATTIIAGTIYVLFVMGWFFKYIDGLKHYFNW